MARIQPATKPTATQVRAQRDRMLSSKLFALSKRLKAFLNFIIDAELEGRSDRLKEFTLGIEVFDKDETFDPSNDAIVRVEASRLRSKLAEYYDGEGKRDPIRIEIPKGHYVPVFSVIDQQPASDASQLEQAVSRPDSSAGAPGRNLGLVGIGLLSVSILYFLLNQGSSEQALVVPIADIHKMSIAVLPFLPLSSGEDDEYFADGLTEEILNSLAQLPELRVTARTSSFFFKGQNLPVPDIATRLGVANVVEGSVRRDGDRLRIVAQLIRASDGVHLWSQTYDEKRHDVFAVQEQIAERVAEVLGVILDDDARDVMHSVGIHDVEAFIAYQKGQEAFVNAHQGFNMSAALDLANIYFDIALTAAPSLTAARLMNADLRGHIIFEISAGIRGEQYAGELQETLAALREEYRLSVELSPPGSARDILSLERTLFSDNWRTLPARIGKAVQSSGCAQMNWSNAFIAPFGWAEQLSTRFREGVSCNPLDTVANFHLAMSLIWSGNFDESLYVIAEAESKGLTHPFLDDGRFWALLSTGRFDDPATRGPGAPGGNMPYDRQILVEALAGDPELAKRMANDYWSGSDTNDFSTLVLAAVIGDRERANDAARRIDAYPGSMVVLSSAIFTCLCGAPFDLEATPNYKARINEAGLNWPPPTRIEYPTKTW